MDIDEDIFDEASDRDEESVTGSKRKGYNRYDVNENYEYELPEGFEDEEIDDDLASGDDTHSPTSKRSKVDSESELGDDEYMDLSDLLAVQQEDQGPTENELSVQEQVQVVNFVEEFTKNQVGINRKKMVRRLEIDGHKDNEDTTIGNVGKTAVSVDSLLEKIDHKTKLKLQTKLQQIVGRGQSTVALPIPLAKHIADKLQRKLAFKNDKIELTEKWEEVIHENRTVEQLDFRDNKTNEEKYGGELTEKFEPTTSVEMEVRKILRDSGIDEESIQTYSELAQNTLTVDQLEKRNAELAKMRSMLFYQQKKDQKAKHIKSKNYRRIKKKADTAAAHVRLNEFLAFNPEMAKEELEKMNTARIKERLTLKHKNTSQWARENLKRGKNIDPQTRRDIQEQLARGRELTKKMKSIDSQSDSSTDTDTDITPQNIPDPSQSDDPDQIRRAKLAELTGIPDLQLPKTGLFAMKFMKRAMDKAIIESEQKSNESIDDYDNSNQPQNPGRLQFGHNLLNKPPQTDSIDNIHTIDNIPHQQSTNSKPGNSSKVTQQSDKTHKVKGGHEDSGPKPLFEVEEFPDESNVIIGKEGVSKKGSIGRSGRTSQGLDDDEVLANAPSIPSRGYKPNQIPKDNPKTNPWLDSKHNKKGTSENSAQIERVHHHQLTEEANMPKGKGKQARRKSDKIEVSVVNDSIAAVDSEQSDNLQKKLVQMAFVGDNVQEQFKEEKSSVSDSKVDFSDIKPGWGSWAGPGVVETENPSKIQSKPIIVKEKSSKRADRLKPHVIINEKRITPPPQYLTPSLPWPYEKKEHYERSLSAPVGTEWAPLLTHKKATAPRIVVTPGRNIDPIILDSKDKKEYTQKIKKKEAKRAEEKKLQKSKQFNKQ